MGNDYLNTELIRHEIEENRKSSRLLKFFALVFFFILAGIACYYFLRHSRQLLFTAGMDQQ